ncbi:uncharacterized protein N7487_008117 [Penicillium crustosum]|uniref:uncharacterized protein n=1 Tax=Penicillium crustosum TaxID=36656 RepID=UPI002386DBDF|nr:uncharacterized protein N7487_008117 [Penicillium crustosum]KAJ5402221.1 hypothetical protein N7487_008117 [Penicillium crustosum]
MSSLGLSQSPMTVELRLDETDSTYTHQDTVSGEVILHTESPADLSTIVLNLSGTATSRLTQSRRTETHNIPQATECYKTGHWSNKPQITCANIPCWPQRKSHLLRKTPPSTGHSESLAEIQYSLSVVVTGKSTVKQTHYRANNRLSSNASSASTHTSSPAIRLYPSESTLSFETDLAFF